MVCWKIIEDSLPPDIKQAVLGINELAEDSPEWFLLSSGNTRRVYRYSPGGCSLSWVVKWGCHYTAKQRGKAL